MKLLVIVLAILSIICGGCTTSKKATQTTNNKEQRVYVRNTAAGQEIVMPAPEAAPMQNPEPDQGAAEAAKIISPITSRID